VSTKRYFIGDFIFQFLLIYNSIALWNRNIAALKKESDKKAIPAVKMKFRGTDTPARKKIARKQFAAAVTKSSRVKASESNPKRKPKRKAAQSAGSTYQADPKQGFPFLDLIPEIRNAIYELALQSEETIVVDRELRLPPLLATCTQIRDEACSIWYRDNQFRAEVNNCDASALNKWSQHCCTVGQRDYFGVTIFLEGQIYWNNLLDWCHAIWKDDRARILVYEPGKSLAFFWSIEIILTRTNI
jgi:hypothetical protein